MGEKLQTSASERIMVRLQDDTRSLKLKVIAMLFNLLPVRVYRALMTLK